MTTGQDIAMRARAYVGTKFHHQGRLIQVGIDCLGLAICVPNDLGLLIPDVQDYGRVPDPRRFLKGLRENLDATAQIEAGCVLSFAFLDGPQQHVGIALGMSSFVHAIDRHLVHEATLSELWLSRLRGVYRYRGVQYG
jgi:cell wall-associated NlpC family hydrolase